MSLPQHQPGNAERQRSAHRRHRQGAQPGSCRDLARLTPAGRDVPEERPRNRIIEPSGSEGETKCRAPAERAERALSQPGNAAFMGSGRYMNYLGDDEVGDQVVAAYGPNYRRLQQLKAKYDPENFFRLN